MTKKSLMVGVLALAVLVIGAPAAVAAPILQASDAAGLTVQVEATGAAQAHVHADCLSCWL